MAKCRRCPTQLAGRAKVCQPCKDRATPRPHPLHPSDPTEPPAGLGPRGQALWTTLGHVTGTPAGELALEACRIADRLEKLDALLRGDRWVDLIQTDDSEPTTVVVVVVKSMAEARGQQATLLAVLTKLGVEAKRPTQDTTNPLAQVIALVQSTSKPDRPARG